jgi:hypothetical protein
MQRFFVALVAATAWADAGLIEPGERAMREAFVSDLRQGVGEVLSYVEQTGGEEAVRRIREARTDAFGLRGFRKGECRPSEGRPGYICDFAIKVDTVAGPIETTITGRFFVGTWGLAYDHDV